MAAQKNPPAKKLANSQEAASVAASTPNTSATESPVIPADVSATPLAENIPLAGESLTSSAPGNSLIHEAEKPPIEGDKYTVLGPLDHDNIRYEIGAEIKLTQAQAKVLPAGVVEPADALAAMPPYAAGVPSTGALK
ncbi:MAG: hypothetical protein Q8O79_00840 [Pseudomonadota bacterium]|nr:hypothetical protein [Pseudomonadota bacterium]